MFQHIHPYPPFIQSNTESLILGTIPPPRFSNGNLLEEDVDFCYGSKFGLLWPILDNIYNLQLEFKNNHRAIQQRKAFLIKNKIGICDIVDRCIRQKNDASDLGMKDIQCRDILHRLQKYPRIKKILFMGGGSKNGPEYLFNKLLKNRAIPFMLISNESPKIHEFKFLNRKIITVSLISPSNAANRSIGANPIFKANKKRTKSKR